MRGFFSEADSLRKPLPLLAECGRCGLSEAGCQTPKMKPAGKGKRILIVGEAPDDHDDDRGKPFAGPASALLRDALTRAGVDLRADCTSTAAVICCPKGDKQSQQKAVLFCRPNLLETVRRINPETVILVGHAAVKSLIGHTWKEDVGPMALWTGWRIPDQTLNAWICPVQSPAEIAKKKTDLAEKAFRNQIKKAVALEGRPWDSPHLCDLPFAPPWQRKVTLLYDTQDVKEMLEAFVKDDLPVAIDYETDGLKPDRKDRTVMCFSVSNGDVTICYPWTKQTERLTKDFLRSDVPKIASNMKFEELWTRAWSGKGIKNWWWDTMLGACVLDNRGGISSIKFQAYVRLGQPDYDSHMRKYLEAPAADVARFGANARNNVRQAPLDQLMVYCGMDSFLEWHVAHKQRKEMGYERE